MESGAMGVLAQVYCWQAMAVLPELRSKGGAHGTSSAVHTSASKLEKCNRVKKEGAKWML